MRTNKLFADSNAKLDQCCNQMGFAICLNIMRNKFPNDSKLALVCTPQWILGNSRPVQETLTLVEYYFTDMAHHLESDQSKEILLNLLFETTVDAYLDRFLMWLNVQLGLN